MNKEEILEIINEIYEESEQALTDALLRIERIASDTRYEGLLILDELMEEMADEDFPAKEYLMLGMDWVCCGVDTYLWVECMENLIDIEETPQIKVFAFLYSTGLKCIQTCEPMSVNLRQQLLVSYFPIRAYNKLFNTLQEYDAIKRKERKQDTSINLLRIHYEADIDSNLEKVLTEMNADKFKELSKKLSAEDFITMLLISDGPLHRRMISSISESFRDRLENSEGYCKYIRNEQIKKTIDNWEKVAFIERNDVNE